MKKREREEVIPKKRGLGSDRERGREVNERVMTEMKTSINGSTEMKRLGF